MQNSTDYVKISKEVALFCLKNDIIKDSKTVLVCKDFANDDGDFVEVLSEDVWVLEEDNEYQNFEIWLK